MRYGKLLDQKLNEECRKNRKMTDLLFVVNFTVTTSGMIWQFFERRI
jgi:hypothetical protein